MTDPKSDAVVPVEKLKADDPQRRTLALALFGALGCASLIESCASPNDGLAAEMLGQIGQANSGAGTIEFADTVTELRAITGGSSGWLAILNGYSAAGDGGGGVFFWSTASLADDGGTALNSGAGTSAGWRRIYSGTLNVRWFGILPNDSSLATTNTSRLNTLFGTYNGATGVSIHCPRGAYYFNGTITIQNITGLHLTGDGDGSTIFEYNASYSAIPFIYFLKNVACIVERITFYGAPAGGSGGVLGTGTSPVDHMLHLTTAGSGGCAQNKFSHCRFQGGKLAGVLIGSGAGTDTNIDQNRFDNCQFTYNDGCGVIVADNNTAYTKFDHCSFGVNGLWSAQLLHFPRGTVFDHCACANSGILDSSKRAHYRIEKTFGENLLIANQTFELQNDGAILSTDVGGGGVFASGNAILQNIHATNSNSNGFLVADCQAAMNYVLDNVIIYGNGHDGSFSINPTTAAPVYGPRSLFTRNVILYNDATLDVRTTGTNAVRWDGAGVSSVPTGVTETSPIAPTVNTTFTGLDLSAAHGTFRRQFTVAGSADEQQVVVACNGTQTSNLVEFRNSAGDPLCDWDSQGAFWTYLGGASTGNAPIGLRSYPTNVSFATIYMGIQPGSTGTNNFAVTSNGSMLWLNAPSSSDEVAIGCGGNQVITVTFATGSALRITTSSGSPEASVAAPVGALCSDTTNGELYIKHSGTGNTGWKLVTHA